VGLIINIHLNSFTPIETLRLGFDFRVASIADTSLSPETGKGLYSSPSVNKNALWAEEKKIKQE
jgi:hypothetical protein